MISEFRLLLLYFEAFWVLKYYFIFFVLFHTLLMRRDSFRRLLK